MIETSLVLCILLIFEGIKSTVASITEFVESRYSFENLNFLFLVLICCRLEKNEEIAPDAEERLQLLNDKEVELEETLQSETVDLEESFLDGTNLGMFRRNFFTKK